jgi:hypothetical protein
MSPELWGALVGLGVVWAMLRDQARQDRETAERAETERAAHRRAIAAGRGPAAPKPVYVTPAVTVLEPAEAEARFGVTPNPGAPPPLGFHSVDDSGRCGWCRWQRKGSA